MNNVTVLGLSEEENAIVEHHCRTRGITDPAAIFRVKRRVAWKARHYQRRMPTTATHPDETSNIE